MGGCSLTGTWKVVSFGAYRTGHRCVRVFDSRGRIPQIRTDPKRRLRSRWRCQEPELDRGAQEFGTEPVELTQWIERIDTIYASAAGTASEIAKEKLYDLSEKLGREIGDVCRVVGRLEAERDDSDIQPLVEALEEALQSWRSG